MFMRPFPICLSYPYTQVTKALWNADPACVQAPTGAANDVPVHVVLAYSLTIPHIVSFTLFTFILVDFLPVHPAAALSVL